MHRLELLPDQHPGQRARTEIRRAQMRDASNTIAAHEGCTQADISKYLHVSPLPLPAPPNGLEARAQSPAAADDPTCAATGFRHAEGLARLEQMRAVFDALDARTFEGFSEAELATLSELLERMIRNAADGDTAQKTMHELVCQLHDLEGDDPC